MFALNRGGGKVLPRQQHTSWTHTTPQYFLSAYQAKDYSQDRTRRTLGQMTFDLTAQRQNNEQG